MNLDRFSEAPPKLPRRVPIEWGEQDADLTANGCQCDICTEQADGEQAEPKRQTPEASE